MKGQFSNVYLGVVILLASLDHFPADCFQRLMKGKLTSNEISSKNFDDIRDIVSASLTANEPRDTVNERKRDASGAQSEDKFSMENPSEYENNIDSESKEASVYEDEGAEDDGNQERVQNKGVPGAVGERVEKSVDRSEMAREEEPEPKTAKDVAKREVRNEDDYEEDDSEVNPESVDSPVAPAADGKNDSPRSPTVDKKTSETSDGKIDKTRDASGLAEDSDLDYERQIEAQIQQRIDAIKEDIKREIERKLQVQEIEDNNAKFDELEFPNEDDEVGSEAASDSSKRSISSDSETSNESQKTMPNNARSKRRSNADEVGSSSEDTEKSALPVKKRSYARRMTLVMRRDAAPKRKDRSSILIPERGHVEVKDDLPADLTLDPSLRVARSNERVKDSENSRQARSADEYGGAERYRREMRDELDVPGESSNFLFPSREKSDPRIRRRRSRGRNRQRSIDRGKSRKHPRRSRRHRAVRESSMDEVDRVEERDKRAMSLDEDAALEYKESFGGFPSDSGGALGRFKRIKRSADVP